MRIFLIVLSASWFLMGCSEKPNLTFETPAGYAAPSALNEIRQKEAQSLEEKLAAIEKIAEEEAALADALRPKLTVGKKLGKIARFHKKNKRLSLSLKTKKKRFVKSKLALH